MIKHVLSLLTVGIILFSSLKSQHEEMYQTVQLNDMSFFKEPGKNWQIVGSVTANLDKDQTLNAQAGEGILVNLPSNKQKSNLFTKMEHGDIDLELEFMMAKHSNSGIYLQGRYEIQLLDSWGKAQPTYGDVGGIYERWDESMPEGDKGFEGYAPRINAARAPGVWQKLFISFQAPRFDQGGTKVQNGKILRIELNGVVIHENVELTGPTRGPAFPEEAPKGPILIQGDHGPVAFRNIRYRTFEPLDIQPQNLSYQVYRGKFDDLPDLTALTSAYGGDMKVLTQEVVAENDQFILHIKGQIDIPNPGTYLFTLVSSGNGMLKVADKPVVNYGWWTRTGDIELEAGTHNIELVYHKRDAWYPNGLGLEVEGPQLRSVALHTLSSMPPGNPVDPIYIDVGNTPKIVRCFVDYPNVGDEKKRRIVHAINVGFPEGGNYTYDPDRATLALAWRGDFLDATPMWNNRGDGSARARGSKLYLGIQSPLAKVSAGMTTWADSLSPDDYRFKGYMLNANGEPIFQYEVEGSRIQDHIFSSDQGKMLTRTLQFPAELDDSYVYRLANGNRIEEISSDTYLVDHTYYIKVEEGEVAVESRGTEKDLVMHLNNGEQQLKYHIMW